MRWLARFIALIVLFGFLPQATHAQAILTKPISELPTPTLVAENRATLLERGCVEVVGDTAAQTVAQPADKPVQLYPNDWTVGKYIFCPEAVKSTVTVKEGKVAAFPLIIIFAGIILGAVLWSAAGTGVSDTVIKIFLFVINALLEYVASIGVLVINFVSKGAEYLLTVGGFVTHPLVTRAWPFLQGLVNIGFLVALIYIAVLIVLRMGESWSKLLARLIIAALLLNFSLVFGGILIDASRLVMAAELRLLSAGSPPSDVPIGLQILKRSEVFKNAFPAPDTVLTRARVSVVGATYPADASLEDKARFVLNKLTAVFLILVLAFGLLYLLVGLVIRYVVLILLLAASPVAYLGIALPNMGGISKQWWSTFWKYLIYGPIALFFLIMLAVIPRPLLDVGQPLVSDLLMMSIIIGLLYAGIQVPKRLGGFGAGLVTGASQRLSSFAKKNPALAAGLTMGVGGIPFGLLSGGIAGYGGYIAGKALGQRGYREARDYVKERTKGAQETLGIGKYSKYDPKTGQARPEYAATGLKARAILATNKEAKGAKDVTSKAKTAADLVKQNGTVEKEIEVEVEEKDAMGMTKKVKKKTVVFEPKYELVPELDHTKLAKKNVLDVLSEKELEKLGEAALEVKNKQVLKIMVQNETVVRNMPTKLQAQLMASKEHPDVSDMLNRTMRNISYKDAAK